MELAIGITLGLLGITFSLFGVDVRHFFSKVTSKDPLLGSWEAKWTSDQDGEVIHDSFSINSIVRKYFRGAGENDSFGPYEIRGYRSETSIAFTFKGVGAKSTLLGSVTMDARGLMEGPMKGSWSNVSVSGEIFTGNVELTRP